MGNAPVPIFDIQEMIPMRQIPRPPVRPGQGETDPPIWVCDTTQTPATVLSAAFVAASHDDHTVDVWVDRPSSPGSRCMVIGCERHPANAVFVERQDAEDMADAINGVRGWRYLRISGGELTLSKVFATREDRNAEAVKVMYDLAVANSGLLDDEAVLLIDNALASMSVEYADYPEVPRQVH